MMPRQVFSTLLMVTVLVTSAAEVRASKTFRESFDEGPPTWRAQCDKGVRPFDHRRQRHLRHEGQGAERFAAQVLATGSEATLVHSLPPAAAIEDLRLSVWVRSSQPGLQLRMRLVFPGETDPETGGPLTVLIAGDRVKTSGEWQQLQCAASAAAVQDALRRVRYRINNRPVSDQGLYVDQAVLAGTFQPTELEILLDDLTFGPVITPARANELLTIGLDVPEPDSPVEFRLNRLTVEGQPFFPIIAPFHVQYGDSFDERSGEDLATFAETGVNVAWVKDYRDDDLLQRLREKGLWVTAIPPRPSDGTDFLDARAAGMLRFGPETRPILFWNLGPRIPSYTLDQLIGWVSQLRAADDGYDRPTLADVTGSEYAFSNHVNMLGVSRHITNTAISYENYRDWLRSRRKEAFLNTFFWTWIQTEPASQTIAARDAAGRLPAILEPEQIRLQVYAALQAGCRGIGYWKTVPFDADVPGAEERRLAIARLNMELKLLEPLLATGSSPGTPVTFSVGQPRPGSDGRRVRPSYHQITITGPQAADTPFAPTERPPGRGEAVVIKSDLGPLLLAVWYGESAQFCPGQMVKSDAKIVVPGIDETASAWLITPTGFKHLVERRVTGGREITIPKFDQTAAVLFTSDEAVRNRFRQATASIAPHAARVTLDLAKAKRQRVAATHQELMTLSPAPPPDGHAMLRRADQFLATAEAAAIRGDHAGTCQAAEDALQALRILQRAHWEDAIRQFASPLASPHAICFSTLPDHYRLIARVGRNILNPPDEANLLPSGEFEDVDVMFEEGWQHTANDSSGLATGGALDPTSPKQGNYSLQLLARRREGTRPAGGDAEGNVSFVSPPMPVTAGQILHVSGWVRVVRPIAEHLDGATLHDNLLGPSAGLRWTRTKTGWEPFEMLREVPRDGHYVLTLTLHGEGEVHFDDVRVVPHAPRASVAEQPLPRMRR